MQAVPDSGKYLGCASVKSASQTHAPGLPSAEYLSVTGFPGVYGYSIRRQIIILTISIGNIVYATPGSIKVYGLYSVLSAPTEKGGKEMQ